MYGTNGNFPDYPKLGDTKDFILVGINTYPHLTSFLSSDVGWISKPPAGATCPASHDSLVPPSAPPDQLC